MFRKLAKFAHADGRRVLFVAVIGAGSPACSGSASKST